MNVPWRWISFTNGGIAAVTSRMTASDGVEVLAVARNQGFYRDPFYAIEYVAPDPVEIVFAMDRCARSAVKAASISAAWKRWRQGR